MVLKTQPILRLQGLKVSRGNTPILKGINWTVSQGENWVILGANGSGKSSLLSTLTAYLIPSSGTIEILGNRFGTTDWNEVRKHIGIVSNAAARRVPLDESVLETVLSGQSAQFGFWTREKSIPTEKAMACLQATEVAHLSERPWGVLSQGERQKVFIARALMTDPEILILDESCAGLDPIARIRFIESLQILTHKKPQLRLIFVTHHIEEIFPEISHILILKEGKVLAAGPKKEILRSETLSQAFGTSVQVKESNGSWQLSIDKSQNSSIDI